MATRYTVQAVLLGGSWVAYIPAVDRGLCARSLGEIEPIARQMVAEHLGLALDSFRVKIVTTLDD